MYENDGKLFCFISFLNTLKIKELIIIFKNK